VRRTSLREGYEFDSRFLVLIAPLFKYIERIQRCSNLGVAMRRRPFPSGPVASRSFRVSWSIHVGMTVLLDDRKNGRTRDALRGWESLAHRRLRNQLDHVTLFFQRSFSTSVDATGIKRTHHAFINNILLFSHQSSSCLSTDKSMPF
jgi:hypothetical protein